jgi:hypothetical protein
MENYKQLIYYSGYAVNIQNKQCAHQSGYRYNNFKICAVKTQVMTLNESKHKRITRITDTKGTTKRNLIIPNVQYRIDLINKLQFLSMYEEQLDVTLKSVVGKY